MDEDEEDDVDNPSDATIARQGHALMRLAFERSSLSKPRKVRSAGASSSPIRAITCIAPTASSTTVTTAASSSNSGNGGAHERMTRPLRRLLWATYSSSSPLEHELLSSL